MVSTLENKLLSYCTNVGPWDGCDFGVGEGEGDFSEEGEDGVEEDEADLVEISSSSTVCKNL